MDARYQQDELTKLEYFAAKAGGKF